METETNLPELLERAIILAATAHRGQVDKAGRPYILHPLRVMMSVALTDDEVRIVAVLHDVVEDTKVTLEFLRADGYPASVVDAIGAMSKLHGESYQDYLTRVKANPLATLVKLADLRDNLNPARMRLSPLKIGKYRAALAFLCGLKDRP